MGYDLKPISNHHKYSLAFANYILNSVTDFTSFLFVIPNIIMPVSDAKDKFTPLDVNPEIVIFDDIDLLFKYKQSLIHTM